MTETNETTRGILLTIDSKGRPKFQEIGIITEVEFLGLIQFLNEYMNRHGFLRLSEGQAIVVNSIEKFIKEINNQTLPETNLQPTPLDLPQEEIPS
jgi:hypothetical protein